MPRLILQNAHFWARVAAVSMIAAALVGCRRDSDGAPPLVGGEGVAGAITISPTVKPAFDSSIHDYTIDCTTVPTAELIVTAPRTIGFEFLGTSGVAGSATPDEQTRFRQTFTLKPGQGFRFAARGRSYSVRCLPPDFPALSVESSGSSQVQWYLFSPTIGAPAGAYYTIITDSHGTPVWWIKTADVALDAKVLGPDQIAWAPSLAPAGSSSSASESSGGTYVIYSFDGHLRNTLAGGLDYHDLQRTPTGNYLAFRYVPRVCPPDCADMSPWGGSLQEPVVDAEIVEMDGRSNVLWRWRTRDHIALSETGESGWYPGVGTDIIHMNAVEPDGADGLMFSARHLNAVYHVTKSTGAIDWKLGGTHRDESLIVVGDVRPSATGTQVLSGQHDIRKWGDGTVSVHDNGTSAQRPPAVVRYRIDLTNRTAEVVELIQDTRVAASGCCGSARLLSRGNWIVQWGGLPFVTELTPGGISVATVQYNLGSAFSYRAVPVRGGIVTADTLRRGMDVMSKS